jgi:hypothetical protein
MQVTQAQFTQVSRFPHDAANTWQHNSKPVWVTFYPAVDGVRPAHYIPYRAVQAVPAGRKPWTVDNRRIGSDRGFSALEDALNAAEVAA